MSNLVNTSLGMRIRDGLRRRWSRASIDLASRIGRYERWRLVDWSRVKRLVFVCSGNICRSPYAEAIATSQGIKALSCGTTASGGAGADPTAIEVASRFNVELGGHSSRPLAEVEILDSDLIVVMDLGHLDSAKVIARRTVAQLTLLGLWDRQHPVVIWDPFGRPAPEFERCFLRIKNCMEQLLDSMQRMDSGKIANT